LRPSFWLGSVSSLGLCRFWPKVDLGVGELDEEKVRAWGGNCGEDLILASVKEVVKLGW